MGDIGGILLKIVSMLRIKKIYSYYHYNMQNNCIIPNYQNKARELTV